MSRRWAPRSSTRTGRRHHLSRSGSTGELPDSHCAREAGWRYGRHGRLRRRDRTGVDRSARRSRGRGRATSTLHRCLGRLRLAASSQDCGDRRTDHQGAVDARRAQRRPGPRLVRSHCALRDHRQGCHLARRRGVEVSMRDVVDLVATAAAQHWGGGRRSIGPRWRGVPTTDLAPFTRGEAGYAGRATGRGTRRGESGALVRRTIRRHVGPAARSTCGAGVSADPVRLKARKPEWMRVPLDTGRTYREIKRRCATSTLSPCVRRRVVPTSPSVGTTARRRSWCWGSGAPRAGSVTSTASRPWPIRMSQLGRRGGRAMGLTHAVVTMVARDDLADGGAQHVADTVQAIRRIVPDCRVEVLVSDFKGDDASLQVVFDARPDVFNHNIETVARLQRAVRPSASCPVAVGPCPGGAGGARHQVVDHRRHGRDRYRDRPDHGRPRRLDCDIVTIGQYLRPTSHHLPVVTWWPPSMFGEWKQQARRWASTMSKPVR